jgi:hypothetical protein
MNTKTYYPNGDIATEIYEIDNITIQLTYHTKHKVHEILFNKNKKLHRDDDLPAYIKLDLHGDLICKIYYKDGKCHRDNNKPAYIKYYNGRRIELKYYINGNIQRTDNKPTYIKYYKSNPNIIKCTKYKSYLYQKFHYFNPNLPMNIIIDNNLIHSPTNLGIKPGMIKYNIDGTVHMELYFSRGKIHRYDGPAKILYIKDKKYKYYFIDGRLIENRKEYITNWSKMFLNNIVLND